VSTKLVASFQCHEAANQSYRLLALLWISRIELSPDRDGTFRRFDPPRRYELVAILNNAPTYGEVIKHDGRKRHAVRLSTNELGSLPTEGAIPVAYAEQSKDDERSECLRPPAALGPTLPGTALARC
jgi:hypothetical protein